jgi:hypothetical protein
METEQERAVPEDRLPAPLRRRKVRRGGQWVEITTGPERETR